MARPCACTEACIHQIADRISRGLPNRDAALMAGVSEATFYAWKARGQAEARRLAQSPRAKPKRSEAPFLEFLEAIKRAEADLKGKMLDYIQKAGGQPKTWQAAAWILERKFPKEFGQRLQVESAVREELEHALDKLERELDAATFDRILEIVGGDGQAEEGGAE